MGRPISLFPWYKTIVPDHHCSFCGLTLASVLRESSKSIAWFMGVKRHILYRIGLRDERGSIRRNFLRHRASSALTE